MSKQSIKDKRQISLGVSLIPVVALLVNIFFVIFVAGQDAHIALVLSAVVATVVAMLNGYKWDELEEGIKDSLFGTLQSLMILWIVGMIIGTWILSGIVPTIIYYGLRFISPRMFLLTSCVIASIVSIVTGSSWSTVGTVGIALMGIGISLGVPAPIVAGSVISGAYFGDKMSPLSDTTNLAPAVSGTDVFTHISFMLRTTTPAYVVSLLIYLIIGFKYQGATDLSHIESLMNGLELNFNISPLLLIPPILVMVMIAKKTPAIPALLISAIVGGLSAILFQQADISSVIDSAMYGFESTTGNQLIDDLLTGGGMISMAYAISLTFTAMGFVGVMERSGMIEVIVTSLAKVARSAKGLVLSTLFTSFFLNVTTGEQYLSVILPGRMFKSEYEKRNLHPKNLSRALEDAGSVSSPLIPWNACAVFMATTLGVSTIEYLPFAFFNLSIMLLAVVLAALGLNISYNTEERDLERH